AVSFKGHKNIVQMLINKGADVNAQGQFFGLFRGHTEIVQRLLNKGADVHTPGGWLGNAVR
ncbi:hypothetical protein LY76DRAFT_475396, partial [Colletotrichum caudatum]